MSSTAVHGENSSIRSSSFTPLPPRKYEYDVFLSFRGEDTRDNFVDHLYTELLRKGIHTFKDDERLERGKVISPELSKAIQESRFSVVVLSRNYASSRWCLNELVKILECNPTTTTVYPVFYHVDPSQVRNQTGDFGKGFEELLSKNEDTIDIDEIQRWREALKEVANTSGWCYPSPTRFETKFIQELVGDILTKLDRTYSRVTEYLVGMDSRVEKVVELLGLGLDDCEQARVIGIWGMGGIGKTTIAKAVCDRISWQFEGCSFLENISENSTRERGLESLQEKILSDILMEVDFKVGNIDHGRTMIKNRVCCKEVLIVFDDVDSSIELEKIVGELLWFHPKSRIIITTRDLHKLITYSVRHVFKVEKLKKNEAIDLFISKAFGKHQPTGGFEDFLHRAVKYAKGLPLALKVLGSFLKGRSKCEWESAISRLKESPDEEVERVLKISYNDLGREEKKIFLDIACFFKGEDIEDVTKILDSCGFNPVIGINVLVERSFITISGCNKLLMHDLIQQLGWNIVFEECPQEPGERSRLWLHKDIKHVLIHNTGTNKVEGIVVENSDIGQLRLSPEAFAKMTNLRILKICGGYSLEDLKYLSNKLRYLNWDGYPLKYMPSTFQPEHLVELHITCSRIEQLWKGAMPLPKLRIMNLSHSTYLTESPNFAEVQNLERLILEGCTGLVNLHPSIGHLRRLICLNLKDCKNLSSLPIGSQLESLELLIASGCSKLKTILGNFECAKRLSELYLDGTGIEELPKSFVRLTNLRLMNLIDCENLTIIPSQIGQLKSLTSLTLSGCSLVDELPEDIGVLDHLKELRLDGTALRKFPSSIVLPENLEILKLSKLKHLRKLGLVEVEVFNPWHSTLSMSWELPNLSRLENLRELSLGYCNIKSISLDILSLQSLSSLDLSGNDFESLPAWINQLKLLKISLSKCKRLQELPELSSEIQFINARDCKSLRTILNPSIYQNITEFDFTNCLKLVEQSNILQDQLLPNQFQVGWRGFFSVFFPGSEISEWFSHQGMGASVSFHLPPHWYDRRFRGFALSVAFELKEHEKGTIIGISLHIGDDKIPGPWPIGVVYGSPGVQVTYIPSRWFICITWEQFNNESGIDIKVSFEEIDEQGLRIISNGCYFKKCGARLIYMDDDDYGDDQALSVYFSEDSGNRSAGKDDAANKSSRSWDGVHEYKVGSSGNDSFQEDHPNNKRLGQSVDPVDHIEILNHEGGPSGSKSFEEDNLTDLELSL